jgi:hypothetical protein
LAKLAISEIDGRSALHILPILANLQNFPGTLRIFTPTKYSVVYAFVYRKFLDCNTCVTRILSTIEPLFAQSVGNLPNIDRTYFPGIVSIESAWLDKALVVSEKLLLPTKGISTPAPNGIAHGSCRYDSVSVTHYWQFMISSYDT